MDRVFYFIDNTWKNVNEELDKVLFFVDLNRLKQLTVISSLLIFIPTFMAYYHQPFFVFLILLGTTIISTIYHYVDELDYNTLDIIMSILFGFCGTTLLTLHAIKYGLTWKVVFSFGIGILANIIYLTRGYVPEGQKTTSVKNYEFWHSLWHILGVIAISLLLIDPLHYNDLRFTQNEVYTKLWKSLFY